MAYLVQYILRAWYFYIFYMCFSTEAFFMTAESIRFPPTRGIRKSIILQYRCLRNSNNRFSEAWPFSLPKLGRIVDYLTYSTRELSIDIVDYWLSIYWYIKKASLTCRCWAQVCSHDQYEINKMAILVCRSLLTSSLWQMRHLYFLQFLPEGGLCSGGPREGLLLLTLVCFVFKKSPFGW